MKNTLLGRAAFSLMEILASMVIISIVSAVTLPEINSFFASERCKAEAEILIQAIRLAKYRALQTQQKHCITFAFETGDVSLYNKTLGENKAANRISSYRVDAISTSVSLPLTSHSVNSPSLDCESILDNEEQWVNDPVIMYSDSSLPEIVIFKEDGLLYSNASTDSPIGEYEFLFTSGNSGIIVYINAYGVISSEVFARPEDDSFDEEDAGW